MRVLALTSYPAEAAATRFRLLQMIAPLRELGIELEVRPLLSSEAFAGLYQRTSAGRTAWRIGGAHLQRLPDILAARRADVVLLQREAALLGPPVIEALLRSLGRRPVVLDLDDPTWISYDSPTFGRLGRLVKWPGKTDWLIDRAALVIGGSRAIVEHATRRGARAHLVPTVVDTEVFRPREASRAPDALRVGWIGTHSTLPYLADLAPALDRAAGHQSFQLVAVGGGAGPLPVTEAEVHQRAWCLDREVEDFRSLDIGLYPLRDDEWARGKSGFKAIQYLACGVPFIVSPVGATCEIGIAGTTHFEARTPDEWVEAVQELLGDPELRAAMGAAGRIHSLQHYTVPKIARDLAAALALALAA